MGNRRGDGAILDRLIDQWIVRSEATPRVFLIPPTWRSRMEVEHLQASFASPEEYQSRQEQSGLSDKEIERWLRNNCI